MGFERSDDESGSNESESDGEWFGGCNDKTKGGGMLLERVVGFHRIFTLDYYLLCMKLMMIVAPQV